MISLNSHDKMLLIAALDRESTAINSAIKLLIAAGHNENSDAVCSLIARGDDISTLRLMFKMSDIICLSRNADAEAA